MTDQIQISSSLRKELDKKRDNLKRKINYRFETSTGWVTYNRSYKKIREKLNYSRPADGWSVGRPPMSLIDIAKEVIQKKLRTETLYTRRDRLKDQLRREILAELGIRNEI
jgi:hypothetical protein